MPYYEWLYSFPSLLQWTGVFLCGMSKYMRSDWGKKKRKQTSGFFHTSKFVFTKKCCFFFVHEQVSDMQTSTVSRNKYTRKQRKVSGGLRASDKHDTDTSTEDIQKHSTVWCSCLSPAIRTYRHYWPRSLFQAVHRRSELLLTDENLPRVAYVFPPHHKPGKCVEVCLPLDSSAERPAASIQHSLPENIQKLKAYRSFTVKENWLTEVKTCRYKRQNNIVAPFYHFFFLICVFNSAVCS